MSATTSRTSVRTISRIAFEATANGVAPRLLDHLTDVNGARRPRVPWIENLSSVLWALGRRVLQWRSHASIRPDELSEVRLAELVIEKKPVTQPYPEHPEARRPRLPN